MHLSESSMEEDWKDNLSTDAKGNNLKTISNLRMIFTHDENLRQIRFDTFCQDDISFSPLFRNVNGNKVDEESVGKIQDYLEQNYDLRRNGTEILALRLPSLITSVRKTHHSSENRPNCGLWRLLPELSSQVASSTMCSLCQDHKVLAKARSSKLLETDGSTTLFRSQVVTRKRLRLSRMVGLSR